MGGTSSVCGGDDNQITNNIAEKRSYEVTPTESRDQVPTKESPPPLKTVRFRDTYENGNHIDNKPTVQINKITVPVMSDEVGSEAFSHDKRRPQASIDSGFERNKVTKNLLMPPSSTKEKGNLPSRTLSIGEGQESRSYTSEKSSIASTRTNILAYDIFKGLMEPTDQLNELHPKVKRSLEIYPPPEVPDLDKLIPGPADNFPELRHITEEEEQCDEVPDEKPRPLDRPFMQFDEPLSDGESTRPPKQKIDLEFAGTVGKYKHRDVGLTFEGKLVDCLPQGWGKFITARGALLEGYFEEGTLTKYAHIYDTDGTVYFGQILNRQKHGIGTYIDKLEQKIVGCWDHGKAEGNIIVTNKEGELIFKGGVKGGFREGFGVFNDRKNKCTYTGEFHKDLYQGLGRMEWENGKVYEGEFSQGFEQGDGVLKTVDGRMLKGRFEKGKPVGKGSIITDYGLQRPMTWTTTTCYI